MTTFKNFLAEEASEEKLKHLEHAEDHVINSGAQGFSHAFHNLKDVHDKMVGKNNKTKITMKYDGSPSVVFGTNPENGRFFVASKSAFNKNPKINYSHEDIERNHGHAPGLVQKLKAALDHFPKVTPKKGVFQGDIMHTHNDLHVSRDKVHFTPNTITYSSHKDSAHGKAALGSKIGVAVHTKYNGKNLESMKAEYAPELKQFKKHKDVHLMSTHHEVEKSTYTPQQQAKFVKHLTSAANIYRRTKPETYESIQGHEIPLKTYINHTVRTGTKPHVDEFMQHYAKSHAKKVDSVKTAKAKMSKTAAMESDIGHVQRNRQHIDRLLKMHHHLQRAKDVLAKTLSTHSEFEHSISGKKSKPEGFVVVRHNRPTKIVDRAEFSAANFNKGKAL
jgi:hypothetical protein